TQKANKRVYNIINEICPDIPILNDLKAVQISESRFNTFSAIKNDNKKINVPRLYNSKLDALQACRKGIDVIVKLDAHNIPDLPKNDRIIGIAKNPADLSELINGREERDLFFQEYIGEHDILYKIYVIGSWVVSITSHNRLQQVPELSPLDLVHIRVPVDEKFRRRIIRLGRKLGMSVFGLDYILTDKGPFIVDVNDFPSFNSIPEGVSLISDYIYNMINMREMYQKAFIKAKS
ncbi:MAG: hypothetical protein ACFE96_03845, partial [Candidatus Hermodarchaeota archaeon]